MKDISFEDVVDTMKAKGYDLYETTNQKVDLNLIGIRSLDLGSNEFNDLLFVAYKRDRWTIIKTPFTSDPGVYYRNTPINPRGTAIVKPGQYKNAFKLGIFKGYDCLRQHSALDYWRVRLDFWEDQTNMEILMADPDSLNLPHETGVIGSHMHMASQKVRSTLINKWSAACQVIPETPIYKAIIALSKEQSKWYDKFTYTLINESDIA